MTAPRGRHAVPPLSPVRHALLVVEVVIALAFGIGFIPLLYVLVQR